MIKKYFIYISLALLSLAGCQKEKGPSASPDIQDPFARVDNPKNEVDHEIYLFYKDSSIPVLYTDTLTKSPLALLNLRYHLTTVDSMVTVKYLNNQADLLAGLNFVKSEIAPYLTKSLKPYSILLTDSVYTFTPDMSGYGLDKEPLSAYLGFNTLAISYVPAIKNMTPAQLKVYRKDILKTILAVKISANPALTTGFYAVSQAYYGKTAYGNLSSAYYIPFQPKGVYGFLVDGTEFPTYYDAPAAANDLSDYLDAALLLSQADFTATYQNYPLVMQKYNLLLGIFKTIDFIVPQ
jgi:hypothetical protein